MDSELIRIEGRAESGVRSFGPDAVTILRVYYELGQLSLQLTHPERVSIIRRFNVPMLETLISEGENALRQYIVDHLDELRPPRS